MSDHTVQQTFNKLLTSFIRIDENLIINYGKCEQKQRKSG